MKKHLFAPMTFATLALAGRAFAQSYPTSAPPQPTLVQEVRVDFGFAAPVGEVGLAYERVVLPHLLLEGGVGMGWSGVQLSIMPKLFFGSPENQIYSGIGLSEGIAPAGWARGQAASRATWLNIDALGYEHVSASGEVVNVGLGYYLGLAGTRPVVCIDECGLGFDSPVPAMGDRGLQFHVGVGYAF